MNFIPLSIPNVGRAEWELVRECLESGWVSSVGGFVSDFEEKFAKQVNAKSAVATSSGTAALHIALKMAGVAYDDEVILPSLTFIAPANAVRYLGGWPTFVDVDERTMQIDPDRVASFLKNDCIRVKGILRNKHTRRRVVGVLPVHILGHPVDLDPILCLAEEYGLFVIQDATESLGSSYKKRKIGSEGVSCFSFNGNKLITTGGGGMITFQNKKMADRARYLTTQAKDDAVEFIHHEVGFNYRLTNIQAAMGVAQLDRVQEFISRKKAIHQCYVQELANLGDCSIIDQSSWAESGFWLNTMRITGKDKDRKLVYELLKAASIETRPLWQPLHLSVAHEGSWFNDCRVSEVLYRQCLNLPSSTGLRDDDLKRVVSVLKDIFC